MSLPVGIFFFPRRTCVIIGLGFTDTEGVSGGRGTGSKPCHLNDCKYKFRQLEPKCCSGPFFPTPHSNPPNFVLSLDCCCKHFRPLSVSLISVNPLFLRQAAYLTCKKNIYIFIIYNINGPPHGVFRRKTGQEK